MSMVNEWQHLKIPFDEIKVATENFKTLLGRGGYGLVFKGKLLVSGKETMVAVKRLNEQHGQGLKEFLTEIQLLCGQQHPNLISLVGYCDEGREKSIVYEYAERGSLDQYIRRTRKTTSTTLTWLQRLKICTDAARGLDHLHSHVGGHRTIIHRDIKSSNILIDENWVAKISDLGLSKLSVTGFGMSDIVSNSCGTHGYCEPEYYTSGIVTKKSDVYSFGVVLFEVLCGRLCLTESDDGFRLSSISAKEFYRNNALDKIIDQSLSEHIGSYSMTKFAEIAYRCLDDDRKQRPAMDVVVKELEEALKYQEEYEFENEWQRLKIPFDEIKVATENFKTIIGQGGYGSVFKGKLFVSGKETTVAIKWLNEQFGQGLKEFSTEIQLLYFGQHHPNLISLVGYCDEGKKKAIVYEYAERGSLDQYIRRSGKGTSSTTTLTWLQRLKICVDAARGLDHLHSNVGGHQTIIHRDVKSSNILIDENWVGKISDLGLPKLSVTDFGKIDIVSNGYGTQGYCEPEYNSTGVVTKKSDVYSFGVVLFEVLCGRLCLIDCDDGFSLSSKSAKEHYQNNTLDKIIDESLREHIGSYSMTKFAAIAYRCLHDDREQRPAMNVVVKELEDALIFQGLSDDDIDEDEFWEKKLPENYQHYIQMSDKPFDYTTKKELYQIFCHGFLANDGKLWFSICKSTHGICSLLSANKIFSNLYPAISLSNSRFKVVRELLDIYEYFLFETTLESVMFSPQYSYACYLLFKFRDNSSVPDNTLLFTTEGELNGISIGTMMSYWSMHPMNIPTIKPKNDYGLHDSSNMLKAEGLVMKKDPTEHLGYTRIEEREDGWMEAMLFKLTNKLQDQKDGCHLWIELSSKENWKVHGMIIEGIEFRPYI